MSHHVGFLYLHDGVSLFEVFNHARTLTHLTNSGLSSAVYNQKAAECATLYNNPCTYAPYQWTTPGAALDPAPWYDGVPGSPSSFAYGFWIEQWTGLDQAHEKRSMTATYPRGSSAGMLGSPGRVWKFNIALFGGDGVALEALFRWLSEMLYSSCCSSCEGQTAWIRTVCPDGYAADTGLVALGGLKLLEGLEWLDPPIETMGCQLRRASFTLGVEDPCFYTPAVRALDDSAWADPDLCALGLVNLLGDPCASSSSFGSWQKTVTIAAPRIGVTTSVVVLKNNSTTDYSPPMTVRAVANPMALSLTSRALMNLGEVKIGGIPPQHELMVDNARRQVLVRQLGPGTSSWEDGSRYLNAEVTDVPNYISHCCGTSYLIIEPQMITENIKNMTVTVDLVDRYGCS